MRIEQYFLMMDYALWKVIVNGDSPPPKRTVDGVKKTYPPTTVEEKLARENKLKGRVIVNGDSPPPKRTVDGVKKTYPPTTVEEKLARENKLKGR
nr:hypothetical protein [Tanacetum cinerariifolium]